MNVTLTYSNKEVHEACKSQILSEKPAYLCHLKGRPGIVPYPAAFLGDSLFGRRTMDLGWDVNAWYCDREQKTESEMPSLITIVEGRVSLEAGDYALGDFIITGEVDFNGEVKPLTENQLSYLEKNMKLGTLGEQPTVVIDFGIK